MNKNIIILVLFFFGSIIYAQSTAIKELENSMVTAFDTYRNADYEDRFENLRPKLKAQIETLLNTPTSFTHPFDSLAQQITILTSKDQNVRVFSWDELTGGTWHDMAVIVQFKTASNTIKTVWIDSDISEEPTGITSEIHYKIYDIRINNQPHYITFGWGTYGSGHHHNAILIFSIENDTISVCSDCIDESYRHIQTPRSQRVELKYDEIKKVISFNEFILDNEIGFYKPTGKRISLQLNNNTFKKITE